jgi:hypothetical protein
MVIRGLRSELKWREQQPHEEINVSKEPEPVKSDPARIDRMKDKDIDYSDIPPLDNSFFTRPTVQWPAVSEETPRTGADLIAALQSSPHREIEIEPERYRVLTPLPPSMLDWLEQQRLRVAEVFRLFHKR